jgi:hypothetical protein
MDRIYVELKTVDTSKIIDRSLKQGNTYVFFVNENFDIKDRNNRDALVDELNYQLKKDGMESLNSQDRNIESELMRLQIGKRVDVKIA